ncbi:hypothetical protein PMAYCL1PPCAC_16724, partial [Pristionchus mayeri]
VLLCIDLYLNFIRKPKHNKSLGVSYQISENRRIILTILPIELTQTLILLFTTAALAIYFMCVANTTPLEQQIFLELVTLPNALPLILTFVIERSVRKSLHKSHLVLPETDYFESLRRSWD